MTPTWKTFWKCKVKLTRYLYFGSQCDFCIVTSTDKKTCNLPTDVLDKASRWFLMKFGRSDMAVTLNILIPQILQIKKATRHETLVVVIDIILKFGKMKFVPNWNLIWHRGRHLEKFVFATQLDLTVIQCSNRNRYICTRSRLLHNP